jgi:hypothetical protein
MYHFIQIQIFIDTTFLAYVKFFLKMKCQENMIYNFPYKMAIQEE